MSEENKETPPPHLAEGHPFDAPPSEPKTRQEENWRLMTILQIPWKDAESIESEEDRKFLLEKANEVEGFLQQQQQMAANQPPNAGVAQPPQPQVEIIKP